MLAQAMAPSETSHKAQSATLAAAVSTTKVESDALPTDGYSLAAIQSAGQRRAAPGRRASQWRFGGPADQPPRWWKRSPARRKKPALARSASRSPTPIRQVSLQFRQEHNGLSVAMSSADPALPLPCRRQPREAGSTNADANAPRSEAQQRRAGGQTQTSADGAERGLPGPRADRRYASPDRRAARGGRNRNRSQR
jgi:hypothetical protein